MSENRKFSILAGDMVISCNTLFPETIKYFQKFLITDINSALARVQIQEEDWLYYRKLGMEACARTEFNMLTSTIADFLMDYDRCIMHGVAVTYDSSAWLITAPSGVGKSTQARFLKELCPEEFGVICGDRPILEFCFPSTTTETGIGSKDENTKNIIIVHPSPWNGKENWYGTKCAPLAGVISLKRGDTNKIEPLSLQDGIISVYPQIIQTGKKPEKIIQAAEYLTKIFKTIPCWNLTSNTVPDSTRLLLSVIQNNESERNEKR